MKWESAEKGWQKTVVYYGNAAFQRIPYEEWSLKSIPPRKKVAEGAVEQRVNVLYPSFYFNDQTAKALLERLGKEKQDFHRRRMRNTILGMPLTIPFALVPVFVSHLYICHLLTWEHT